MAFNTTQPVNITGVRLSNPTGMIGNYNLSYITGLKKGSWKYNGTVYSGVILTVGPGYDYATLYAAYDAVEFNASITTALLLVDPTATAGTHDSNLDGYYEGYLGISGIKKTLFVRGTGNAPTIINIPHNDFYYYYMNCDVYLENITFTQISWRMCVPFTSSSNNLNFFINKCNLFAYENGYCYGAAGTINYQDNINTHISYTSMDKGWSGKKFQHFVFCNLSQITLDKVQFAQAVSAYQCYGSLVGDYVETPTEGYGSAYGSLLITDWVYFNEERVLSWGGGEFIEIPTDGSYILSDGTNTITAMVDYSALPATDQSDMITISCYDRYWVGGSGLWTDVNHWSLTSGGTGGAAAPTINDDVFIDENSFTEPGHHIKVT